VVHDLVQIIEKIIRVLREVGFHGETEEHPLNREKNAT
jgi:hypothetical protein